MGLLDPRVGERKRGRQWWLRPFDRPVSPGESGLIILLLKLPPTEWGGNFFEEFECRRLRVGQFRRKRAKSPLGATQNGDVKKFEDDVRHTHIVCVTSR